MIENGAILDFLENSYRYKFDDAESENNSLKISKINQSAHLEPIQSKLEPFSIELKFNT